MKAPSAQLADGIMLPIPFLYSCNNTSYIISQPQHSFMLRRNGISESLYTGISCLIGSDHWYFRGLDDKLACNRSGICMLQVSYCVQECVNHMNTQSRAILEPSSATCSLNQFICCVIWKVDSLARCHWEFSE